MLAATDTKHAPWHVVGSDDKKRARLNLIAHFLGQVPYKRREAGEGQAGGPLAQERLRRRGAHAEALLHPGSVLSADGR